MAQALNLHSLPNHYTGFIPITLFYALRVYEFYVSFRRLCFCLFLLLLFQCGDFYLPLFSAVIWKTDILFLLLLVVTLHLSKLSVSLCSLSLSCIMGQWPLYILQLCEWEFPRALSGCVMLPSCHDVCPTALRRCWALV